MSLILIEKHILSNCYCVSLQSFPHYQKTKKKDCEQYFEQNVGPTIPCLCLPLSPPWYQMIYVLSTICAPGKHSNKANWSLLWQFYIVGGRGVVNFNALINRIIRHYHSPYHHHYISYILILSGVCVVWLTVLPCPPQYPPHVLLLTRAVYPHLWTSLSSSSSSSSSAAAAAAAAALASLLII